jgi:hypothetical protein
MADYVREHSNFSVSASVDVRRWMQVVDSVITVRVGLNAWYSFLDVTPRARAAGERHRMSPEQRGEQYFPASLSLELERMIGGDENAQRDVAEALAFMLDANDGTGDFVAAMYNLGSYPLEPVVRVLADPASSLGGKQRAFEIIDAAESVLDSMFAVAAVAALCQLSLWADALLDSPNARGLLNRNWNAVRPYMPCRAWRECFGEKTAVGRFAQGRYRARW